MASNSNTIEQNQAIRPLSAGEILQKEEIGHVAPFWVLLVVFIALLVLTALTVGITIFDFGYTMNLVLALSIATVKALLVVLFFMHLAYDKPFNILIFIASLVFIALFILVTLLDVAQYQPTVIPGYAPALADPTQ